MQVFCLLDHIVATAVLHGNADGIDIDIGGFYSLVIAYKQSCVRFAPCLAQPLSMMTCAGKQSADHDTDEAGCDSNQDCCRHSTTSRCGQLNCRSRILWDRCLPMLSLSSPRYHLAEVGCE
jgi:hypothetical protein